MVSTKRSISTGNDILRGIGTSHPKQATSLDFQHVPHVHLLLVLHGVPLWTPPGSQCSSCPQKSPSIERNKTAEFKIWIAKYEYGSTAGNFDHVKN